MSKPKSAKAITWRTEQRRLDQMKDWPKNPRYLSDHDAAHLRKSIDEFGYVEEIVLNTDGMLIGGHMRRKTLLAGGADPRMVVDVRIPSRKLTEKEHEALAIRLNKNAGSWDWDKLGNEFDLEHLVELGFTDRDLELGGLSMDAPTFEPSTAEDQPRLDEKKKVTCPKCKHEFHPA